MTSTQTQFKRDIEWRPAFDKRAVEPSKNYGIHGMEMRFLVHGPKGTVQFLLYTGWHLPHVRSELRSRGDGFSGPLPADLGYHADEPQYDGQEVFADHCEYRDGPCYYDGSGLQADDAYGVLVTDGIEALWLFLEEHYALLFEESS